MTRLRPTWNKVIVWLVWLRSPNWPTVVLLSKITKNNNNDINNDSYHLTLDRKAYLWIIGNKGFIVWLLLRSSNWKKIGITLDIIDIDFLPFSLFCSIFLFTFFISFLLFLFISFFCFGIFSPFFCFYDFFGFYYNDKNSAVDCHRPTGKDTINGAR